MNTQNEQNEINETNETIILIGNGVRECAILYKLLESPNSSKYSFVSIGTNVNPFLERNSRFFKIDSFCLDQFENLDKQFPNLFCSNVTMAIIGPEAPIANRVEEWLETKDIFTIAPNSTAAQIETSKLYLRLLLDNDPILKRHNPQFVSICKGANIDSVNNIDVSKLKDNLLSIKSKFKSDLVIKKDGLCGGKGVYVEKHHFDLVDNNDNDNLQTVLEDIENYNSILNNRIVVEEKLEGIEFSLQSLVDINGNLLHFDPIFDYKRLEDGDKGPNTGSMGAVLLNKKNLEKININVEEAQKINERVIMALKNNNKQNYKGVLYGSFMQTKNGDLYIIEYNCRFGDTEGALALLNIDNDLITTFSKLKEGQLCGYKTMTNPTINHLGVYIVPESYGIKPNSNLVNSNLVNSNSKYDIYFRNHLAELNNEILFSQKNSTKHLTNSNNSSNLKLFYGDCSLEDNHLYTNKSRTLLLVNSCDSLYEANRVIYENINDVISNVKWRTDIGANFMTQYEGAGVSVELATESLDLIKSYVKQTYNEAVQSDQGDFGGVYKLNNEQLVSSIDGVGTKSEFIDTYFGNSEYEGLGMDIVNHCINDILVMGARPLFFLDYFGTARLNKVQFVALIKGMTKALSIVGHGLGPCPLIGGETAEMPLIYKPNKTDIVGCIIGKLDSEFINFPRKPGKGDLLYCLKSNGPHTNGFSLINSLDLFDLNLSDSDREEFKQCMITPHTNYLPIINELLDIYGRDFIIRMAHITGGGLTDNLKRVIPENLEIVYDTDMLSKLFPTWCKIIQQIKNLKREEMYPIFNCGIGMVLVLDARYETILKNNSDLFKIGYVKE